MLNTQSSVSWWTWVLHVSMVIIGGFLIANLALAVIFLQFTLNYQETPEDPAGFSGEACESSGLPSSLPPGGGCLSPCTVINQDVHFSD